MIYYELPLTFLLFLVQRRRRRRRRRLIRQLNQIGKKWTKQC